MCKPQSRYTKCVNTNSRPMYYLLPFSFFLSLFVCFFLSHQYLVGAVAKLSSDSGLIPERVLFCFVCFFVCLFVCFFVVFFYRTSGWV